MTPRTLKARSGITLTEILISILILGVGMISLATLFPLGLVRLRTAQRLTRSAFLIESAISDLGSRNLLNASSFNDPRQSPWFRRVKFPDENYNPMLVDTPAYGFDTSDTTRGPGVGISVNPYGGNNYNGSGIVAGPGLPVAYDPLWRYVTKSYPDFTGTSGIPEGRFASGLGFVRPEGGTFASAHGLQRISNLEATIDNSILPQFAPKKWVTNNAQFLAQIAQNGLSISQTFISPEDIVLQDSKGVYQDPNATSGVNLATPSTLVPDLSGGGIPTYDRRFTWLFTCRQADVTDSGVIDGDIVICESRPFAIEAVTSPIDGSTVAQVAGETVVEAVWGYSSTPDINAVGPKVGLGAGYGYASPSARRSAVLRWPATMPDPDVRVGQWIADVTYERSSQNLGRFPHVYPGQRCHWYQVVKRTEPTTDPGFPGDPSVSGGFRRTTVWVRTPLRAMSMLNFNTTPASPAHVESVLIMPSVVQVIPRTIYSR